MVEIMLGCWRSFSFEDTFFGFLKHKVISPDPKTMDNPITEEPTAEEQTQEMEVNTN